MWPRYAQVLAEHRGAGWAIQTMFGAVALDVPTPLITRALQARVVSRQEESHRAKLLSTMCIRFGDHVLKRES
jgi:6-phosphogluconate dehydrogenase (decarboxylating)